MNPASMKRGSCEFVAPGTWSDGERGNLTTIGSCAGTDGREFEPCSPFAGFRIGVSVFYAAWRHTLYRLLGLSSGLAGYIGVPAKSSPKERPSALRSYGNDLTCSRTKSFDIARAEARHLPDQAIFGSICLGLAFSE